MIVLGRTKNGYICEVSHGEIEKFYNKYWGQMQKLEVGDILDLGKGYDFHQKTQEALIKISGFIEAHKDVVKVVTEGLTIFTKKD